MSHPSNSSENAATASIGASSAGSPVDSADRNRSGIGAILGRRPRRGGISDTDSRLLRTNTSTVRSMKLRIMYRGGVSCAYGLPSFRMMSARQYAGIASASVRTRSTLSPAITAVQSAAFSLIVGTNCSSVISASENRAASVQNRSELPKAVPWGGLAGRLSKRSNATIGSNISVSTFQPASAVAFPWSYSSSRTSHGDGSGPLCVDGRISGTVPIPDGVCPKVFSTISLSISAGRENGWVLGFGFFGGLPRRGGAVSGSADASAHKHSSSPFQIACKTCIMCTPLKVY